MTQSLTELPDSFTLSATISAPLRFDDLPKSDFERLHGVYVIFESYPGESPDLTSGHVVYIGKARMQNFGTRCGNHGKVLRDREGGTTSGKRMKEYARSIGHDTSGLHVVLIQVEEGASYLIASVEEYLLEAFGRRHDRLPKANTQGYHAKAARTSRQAAVESAAASGPAQIADVSVDDGLDDEGYIRDRMFEEWINSEDGRSIYSRLLDGMDTLADDHYLGFVYTGKSAGDRELRVRILGTNAKRGFLNIATVWWNRRDGRFDANVKATSSMRIGGIEVGSSSDNTLEGRVAITDTDGVKAFLCLILKIAEDYRLRERG